jgi:hypothetical protein
MTKRNSLSPARKQSSFRVIEANAGREELAMCLEASGNPRADRLVEMMLDPAYAGLSFGQLCSRTGLSAIEVAHLVCQRKVIEGMLRMSFHLPDIMEDTALAALGRSEPCRRCKESGIVDNLPCADCSGTGEVRVLGDFRAVKLVFQLCGLIR